MAKFRIVISLLIAAAAVIFAVRYRALRHLKVEQEQLQQQAADVTNLSVAKAETESIAGTTNTLLSADERSELLRLRGQAGMLRQELAQASNRLATVSRAPRSASLDAPDEPIVSQEEAIQKINQGKQWMVALIIYASDHQDQFPATMAEASGNMPPEAVATADKFEYLLGSTNISSVRSPATTIVLRERKPWKNAHGRWNRTYAFADGHVELGRSDTPDFTAWEELKTKPPENTDAANAVSVH